jgi:predicted Zn-dependent peptidase
VPLDRIEAAIDEELDAVRKTPIGADELERALNLYETGLVTRLESLLGRAFLLARYQSELGDAGAAAKDLERYRSATRDGIRDVAQRVLLPEARVILRVVPKRKAGAS